MKKQIILILFLLGNLTNSFSQNNKTAFDDLVGIYTGFSLTDQGLQTNKIAAELTSDFNLKITENFDGLLIEHINEKLSPQAAGETKDGDYLFEFKPASEKSELELNRIIIHTESLISNTNLVMSISFKKQNGEKGIFAVQKKGGNPKMPTKDINFSELHNSVFYFGKTQDDTFGDYKIEWFPSEGIGYLNYKNVTNVFKIERKEFKYRLTNKYDIDLEYIYNDWGEKKMKLLDIHSGKNLLKQRVKYGRMISAKAVGTEEDFLIKVGTSFYDAIRDRYKPKGNYTLTHDNKLNGKGIGILSDNEMFAIYAGEMTDGIFHGEGSIVRESESGSGTFKNGNRYGHFNMKFSNGGVASGEFVNGIQAGIWKSKQKNGATFDLIFENGKKIKSTHTNSHLGVENKRISKLVKQGREVGQIRYKIEGIGERIERCVNLDREENTLADYKYCLAGLRDDIDEIRPLLSTAIDHSEKTIKEAEKEGCFQVAEKMKKVKHLLEVTKDKFQSARYYIKDLMTADNNKDVRKEAIKITNYLVGAEEFFIKSQKRFPYIKVCNKYPDTGFSTTSTTPSRSAAENNSTSKTHSSKSTNKNTASEKSTAAARPIVYPPFSGKHEGDNLLLLMGRKLDDPAVQGLLNDSYFNFKDFTVSNSEGKHTYACVKYNFTLKFKNGVLNSMNFLYASFDKNAYFKKRMPLGIPMAQPISKMKNMKDDWKLFAYGSVREYTISKYQLSFEAKGDVNDGDVIHIVNINAENDMDWNSYYQQFK